jgi:hypothetical protein
MLGQALYARLSADAGVTALCGANLYPNYIRESEQLYPQIVYAVEDVAEDAAHDGLSGLITAKARVTAVGKTYAAADALAAAVLASLDAQTGSWGTSWVLGCWLDDLHEDLVHDPSSEQVLYYLKELTFQISYQK